MLGVLAIVVVMMMAAVLNGNIIISVKDMCVMGADYVSELVFLTNNNSCSCWFDRCSDCSCDSDCRRDCSCDSECYCDSAYCRREDYCDCDREWDCSCDSECSCDDCGDY